MGETAVVVDGAPSLDELACWAAVTDLDGLDLGPRSRVLAHHAELTVGGQLDALVMLERLPSWVDAQQQRVLAAITRIGRRRAWRGRAA